MASPINSITVHHNVESSCIEYSAIYSHPWWVGDGFHHEYHHQGNDKYEYREIDKMMESVQKKMMKTTLLSIKI